MQTHLNEKLLQAAQMLNLELCIELLGRGADVEAKSENLRTPLGWAALNGHIPTCLALLERGANIEAADNNQRTPLIWAAVRGLPETCMFLLDHGANIEALDSEGRTPLALAAWRGHAETCVALLNRGANIEAQDDDGRSPLATAASRGHNEICLTLITCRADVGSTSMNAADLHVDWEVMSKLTPLQAAAQLGNLELLSNVLRLEPRQEFKARFEEASAIARKHNNHEAEALIQSCLAARCIDGLLDIRLDNSERKSCKPI